MVLKESQGWRNHSGDLFACYVEFFDNATQFQFMAAELWRLELEEANN
jgi:hypothetical protein